MKSLLNEIYSKMNESVIQKYNAENPDESEVWVPGMAVYSYGSIRKNIQGKIADLAEKAQRGEPKDFASINSSLNMKTLQTLVSAYVAATEEMMKARGEDPEDLKF